MKCLRGVRQKIWGRWITAQAVLFAPENLNRHARTVHLAFPILESLSSKMDTSHNYAYAYDFPTESDERAEYEVPVATDF